MYSSFIVKIAPYFSKTSRTMETRACFSQTIKGWLAAFFACGLVLLAGCATSAKKTGQLRGWVGGKYQLVRTFPKTMAQKPKKAVLTLALGTNTPAYVAGLREGDLILELDHKPINHLRDFYRKIDASKPGVLVPVSVYHDGQTLDYNVTMGRETFSRKLVSFSVEFPFIVHGWQFWPTPDFPGLSLVVVGYRFFPTRRAELGSTENSYARKRDPNDHPYDQERRYWLGIFAVESGRNILSQELVDGK